MKMERNKKHWQESSCYDKSMQRLGKKAKPSFKEQQFELEQRVYLLPLVGYISPICGMLCVRGV